MGSAEFPAFGTLRLVCEFLKKGRRLLRSGSLIAAPLPTSLPINQTPGNGDTEAGGLGPSSPSCSSIQGAKASWLLMASKVSFARNCVFFTFPYQVLPPNVRLAGRVRHDLEDGQASRSTECSARIDVCARAGPGAVRVSTRSCGTHIPSNLPGPFLRLPSARPRSVLGPANFDFQSSDALVLSLPVRTGPILPPKLLRNQLRLP